MGNIFGKNPFTGGKSIFNPLGQDFEQTFDPKQPFESPEDFLAPGFGDTIRGLGETPDPAGRATPIDPRSEAAFAELIPSRGGAADFRETLRRRLEGSGLSSAAAAAGAQRGSTRQTLAKVQAAQPILSALQSLRNRLERTGEGIDVTSKGEALLSGFFG